jgi:predicted nucleotidyltransferase/uncharacterized protein with HEPN domain
MRDSFEQLRRIQDAITKIAEYARKGRLRFDKEEEVRLSVIHYLQIIGEAAQAMPLDYKDQHPEIPWKQMVSFQNFLTFYYIEIDGDTVWRIVEHDLPNLKPKIDAELGRMISRAEHRKNLESIVSKRNAAVAFRELLQAKREDILHTAIRHGVFNVRVFGSVARGEADAESDIDLLVDVEPGRTLFDLSELLMDLQDLLGRNVDIVTEKGLNSRIRQRVLKEAVPL